MPKRGMHPRNRDRDGYDFAALARTAPDLKRFIVPHPCGGDTINFSEPHAVTALNRALLHHHYGVARWEVPAGYLCPAVPGRADYLHHAADLLASDGPDIPRGSSVSVLDVGVGANCVYPIIGVKEYGWRFVGTEIDRVAFDSARRIVATNAGLDQLIELRLQPSRHELFSGVVKPEERFALTMCNPPFHASETKAAEGTQRKLRNLGAPKSATTVLNFGGQSHELWCEGGEPGFVNRLLGESAHLPELAAWFTTLVSKSSSLPAIYHTLNKLRAVDVRTIPMAQGQKQSRIVAWTFLPDAERRRRLIP